MNLIPHDGGGSGTTVKIAIAEFRELISGMESAESELNSAKQGAESNLGRHYLSTSGLSGLTPILTWITDTMPDLRRRLARAEALSQTRPGMPNTVSFAEESIGVLTPAQAREKARRAAELMSYSPPLADDLDELNLLLALYSDDPYFAHEFARNSDPRAWAEYIRALTPYDSLLSYLSPEEYEELLSNLAATIGLASRGTGELDLGEKWRTDLATMMVMPLPKTSAEVEQNQRDMENRPALWLLLSRGHFSTSFLKDITTGLAHLDREGMSGIYIGAPYIAIAPNGQRFMDPMVALMGALVKNPEAAHWAFTQGGTTQVPFPKDGEGATGPVQTFLYNLFTKHRFADDTAGPQTVLMAMRAAMMWQYDDSIAQSAENLQKSMQQQQQVWDETPWFKKWGHTILDILGLIPFVGEPADAANAAWYAAEGDWVNAGLSAASLLPFAGAAVGLGRVAGRLGATLKLVDKLGNTIDPTSGLAKALAHGIQVDDGVFRFVNPADLNGALRGKHPNMEFRSSQLSFTTDAAGNVSGMKVYVDGKWIPVDNSVRGLKLSGYKAGDSVWDMIGLPRGEVIESALAASTYQKIEHVGKLRNGFYPTIDFYDSSTGTAVSLKTVDPPTEKNFATIKKNLRDLAKMNKSGVIPDGRPLKSSFLDLRVKIGQENHPDLLKLEQYAKDLNVKLRIQTY